MDFQKIITENKLSQKEKEILLGNVEEVISEIDMSFETKNINAKIALGGSAAKGTMLKGDFDVDLFAQFDYSYRKEDLSILLEKVLENFEPKRVPGSRDYFKFKYKGINFEVVPVLDIKSPEQAENVTDASPLHVNWVKRKTASHPELIDQIILTKKFMKANRLYGAESYIGGFSGHVVDILTIHYGGFMELLKASQDWEPYTRIDPENHGTKINKSKRSPLILIDPIQPDRNAAAALTMKKFKKFKTRAKDFLKDPSKDFFHKEELTKQALLEKAKQNRLIYIEAEPVEGKKDVVGAKLMKSYQYIKHQLKSHDFKIIDSGWEWKDKGILWYIVPHKKLHIIKEHPGPPLKNKRHVEKFKEQHKETYVRKGRIFAEIKRKYTEPEKLIQDVLQNKYIKTRTKSTSVEFL